MNKLLKRGLKAYNIFLKNKLAMSLMMLFAGAMMTIAAINGNGNDTKTLPLMILSGGMGFSFWSLYRLGYIKASLDHKTTGEERESQRKVLFLQILETIPYLAVAVVGAFLLANENFTNMALNLMTGFFTTLNGVFGAIDTYKNREKRNFRWYFVLVLTLLELGLGIYFLVAFRSIEIGFYLVVGIITAIGGILETIKAVSNGGLKAALDDGKEIVKTLKND